MKTAKRQAQTPTAMRVPGVVKAAGVEVVWDSDVDCDMVRGGGGRLWEGMISGA